MPEITYPPWVTDGSVIPAVRESFARKFVYVVAVAEKLRRLQNAVFIWARHGSLTAVHQGLLAEIIPCTGSGYDFGKDLTDRPDLQEAEAWKAEWWKPRQHAAQRERARLRGLPTADDLSIVDLGRAD